MLKLLLLLIIVGAVIYGGIRLWQGALTPPPRRGPSRPVAPDDDADFLRELDRKRREGELGP